MVKKGVKRVITFVMVVFVILSMTIDDAYANSYITKLGYVPYDAYALVQEDSVYSNNDKMDGIKPGEMMLIEETTTGKCYATVKYYDKNGEYVKEGCFYVYYVELDKLQPYEDLDETGNGGSPGNEENSGDISDTNNQGDENDINNTNNPGDSNSGDKTGDLGIGDKIDNSDTIGGKGDVLVDGLQAGLDIGVLDKINPDKINRPSIDKVPNNITANKVTEFDKNIKLEEVIGNKLKDENEFSDLEEDLEIGKDGDLGDELVGDISGEAESVVDESIVGENEDEESGLVGENNGDDKVKDSSPIFNVYPPIYIPTIPENKDEIQNDYSNEEETKSDDEIESNEEEKSTDKEQEDEINKEEVSQDNKIDKDENDVKDDCEKDENKIEINTVEENDEEDDSEGEEVIAKAKQENENTENKNDSKNEKEVIKNVNKTKMNSEAKDVDVLDDVTPLSDVPQTGVGGNCNWMMLLIGCVCMMTFVTCCYKRNLQSLKKVAKI